MRYLATAALLILLGAGCGGTKTFQGPEDYVSPTTPPPSSTNDSPSNL